MKTTRTTIAACAILLALAAVAPAVAVDLAALGVTVVSAKPEGGRTVYELRDQAGNRLTVVGDAEVTDAQAKAVAFLRDSLTGWKTAAIPSLRVTLSGSRAEALVVPTRYAWEGKDLSAYIPSGLQFYLDSILEYDFRMKVGSIFLRMKGQYFGEAELAARVAEAARDPIRFLERTDPEYLYRTLQEVTTALKGLESGGDNAMQSLRDLLTDYQALKAQKPLLERKLAELDATDAALLSRIDAIEAAGRELQADLEELAASHGELARRHEALEAAVAAEANRRAAAEGQLAASLEKLQAAAEAAEQSAATELERLRRSMLTLHNTGLFRGPTAMDPKLVARTVELKRANAALTTSEILTTLKAEGVAANKKQVDLILAVYFPAAE